VAEALERYVLKTPEHKPEEAPKVEVQVEAPKTEAPAKANPDGGQA
jgi:hypothetical protein